MTPERAKRFASSPLTQVILIGTTVLATHRVFGAAIITLIVASAMIIAFGANAIRYMRHWRCRECDTRLPIPIDVKHDFVYCPHCSANLSRSHAEAQKQEEM